MLAALIPLADKLLVVSDPTCAFVAVSIFVVIVGVVMLVDDRVPVSVDAADRPVMVATPVGHVNHYCIEFFNAPELMLVDVMVDAVNVSISAEVAVSDPNWPIDAVIDPAVTEPALMLVDVNEPVVAVDVDTLVAVKKPEHY